MGPQEPSATLAHLRTAAEGGASPVFSNSGNNRHQLLTPRASHSVSRSVSLGWHCRARSPIQATPKFCCESRYMFNYCRHDEGLKQHLGPEELWVGVLQSQG